MPDSSNGNYTLPSVYKAQAGTVILDTQHNEPLEDIQNALSNRLSADGRKPMTGPLILAGDGTAPLHAVTVQQISKPNALPQYLLKVENLAALEGLAIGIVSAVYRVDTGDEWHWSGQPLAAKVTGDPSKANYIAPSGTDGSQGAWVRQIFQIKKNATRLTDFGAKVVGEAGADQTANVQAFKRAVAALTENGGGDLVLSAGNLQLASAALATSIVTTVPIRIIGEGRDFTKIERIGAGGRATFVNRAPIKFEGLYYKGISGAIAGGEPEFLYTNPLQAATGPLVGVMLLDSTLDNIGAQNWLRVWNESTYPVQDIQNRRLKIISRLGNMAGPNALGSASDVFSYDGMIPLNGSGNGTLNPNYNGRVEDAVFEDIEVIGDHIKKILNMNGGCRNFLATRIKGLNIGATAGDFSGAYAFMLYDAAVNGNGYPLGNGYTTPTGFELRESEIRGVKSCGIYGASAGKVIVEKNLMTGQTDTQDGSQATGMIAGSFATLHVIDNLFEDFHNGMCLDVGGTYVDKTKLVSRGNIMRSARPNATGVKARGTYGKNGDVVIQDTIELTGAGSVGVLVTAGNDGGVATGDYAVNHIIIDCDKISAKMVDVRFSAANALVQPSAVDGVKVINCKLKGTGTGIAKTTPWNIPIYIGMNDIDMAARGAGEIGMDLPNLVGEIGPNTYRNCSAATKFCFSSVNGVASVAPQTFINVVDAARVYVTAGALGVFKPAAANGNNGDFVANLNRDNVAGVITLGWHKAAGTWHTQTMAAGA